MKKPKPKSPKISYEFVPEKEQGRQLDMAFNILFDEVIRVQKERKKLSTNTLTSMYN